MTGPAPHDDGPGRGAGPVVIPTPSELAALVGVRLGPGPWLRVDQGRVDAFAEVTGDHQWIHVDTARAAHGRYGGTVVHGQLTLSLVSSLTADLYRLELGSARLNYGFDRVRFPTPVPVGARIRLHATFAAPTPRDAGLLLPIDLVVELEHAERPACVARKLSLVLLE